MFTLKVRLTVKANRKTLPFDDTHERSEELCFHLIIESPEGQTNRASAIRAYCTDGMFTRSTGSRIDPDQSEGDGDVVHRTINLIQRVKVGDVCHDLFSLVSINFVIAIRANRSS